MNSISIVSTLAMAVGLAAALPQILQMLRTRSSGGQSVLGWGMGLLTNLSMAYVNLFGFGAKALMASNLLSATLCVSAMVLIVRFGARGAPAGAGSAPATPSAHAVLRPVLSSDQLGTLIELPTTEFAALREVVLAVEEARGRPLARRNASDHERALAVA